MFFNVNEVKVYELVLMYESESVWASRLATLILTWEVNVSFIHRYCLSKCVWVSINVNKVKVNGY